MRKYQANQWLMVDKKHTIQAHIACNLELHVATPGTIALYGVTPEGETICLASTDKELHLKNNFNGFTGFELELSKPGGAKILVNGKETAETMNHEPPPAPVETNNIIARMRETARQEMGITRENFLDNDTGLPGYETDADYTFEEEEAAIQQQIANTKASADGDKTQSNTGEKPDGKVPEKQPETNTPPGD